MKNQLIKKKHLIRISVILTILLAVGFSYLRQKSDLKSYQMPQPILNIQPTTVSAPTTSPDTSNWQIYTDQKFTSLRFNYSVAYPLDLEVSKIDLQNMPYSVIFNKKNKRIPTSPVFYYVSVIPDGFKYPAPIYNLMPQDITDSFYNINIGNIKQTRTDLSKPYSDFYVFKKLPNTTVAGLQGVTVENNNVWDGLNGLIDRRVFVRKNGYTYMLGTYYQTPTDLDNFQTFLSSFQFTK